MPGQGRITRGYRTGAPPRLARSARISHGGSKRNGEDALQGKEGDRGNRRRSRSCVEDCRQSQTPPCGAYPPACAVATADRPVQPKPCEKCGLGMALRRFPDAQGGNQMVLPEESTHRMGGRSGVMGGWWKGGSACPPASGVTDAWRKRASG